MKSNNLASFGRRYWALLLALALFLSLSLSETLFQTLGTFIYLPALVFGSITSALLVRHFFFAQTLDEDAHSGFFVAAWHGSLDPRDRVFANLAMIGILFLGAAIIAAALAK